jgi:replicative DNA helicase
MTREEMEKSPANHLPAGPPAFGSRWIPSVGKSALALNLLENIAVRRNPPRPVLMFSLEMGKQSLLERLVSSVAQVDTHKFRTGHFSGEDKARVVEALTRIAPAPLWIDDAPNATVAQLTSRAERIQREHGLALLVVDYLQLVTGSRRFTTRQEEVSDISRGLKAMAKRLHIPVLALSQLSRRAEKDERAPMLSDLRESGAIEQDADVVMFIHRPKFFDVEANEVERGESELHIAKQRNGPTDLVKFVFRSRLTRFEEAIPDMFGDER